MEKDLNDSVVLDSSCLKDSEADKSFVEKFKSIINNTPLSKWFRKQDDNRATVRRRDEVFEDEEMLDMQPPSKRVKLPLNNEGNNCSTGLFTKTPISTTNDVKSVHRKFNHFPEPMAGPSGVKSRKLLNSAATVSTSARDTFCANELVNGHKESDSEESTSGYSSMVRIGSKEHVFQSEESSKQTSPLQNTPSNSRSLFQAPSSSMGRSLFAEQHMSPKMNSSLSSRRPSFNASTFGSPNFVDKTLSTKRIINSPFYNGRTVYGGASAYGRKLGRNSQELRTNLKNSVQIKPVNKAIENGNVMLGKTARRILDTLEQYSSPVNDAKKIPIASKKLRQDGLLAKYTGANPYTVRGSKSFNRELQVPSVTDLLKMKQKTRLQDSTEAVRQIAISSKSDLNSENYKLSVTENEKDRYVNKIKTKVTSLRQKPEPEESVSEVNLKSVALPITTLPKFDFIPPSPPAKIPEKLTQPVNKIQPSPISTPVGTRPVHKVVETEKKIQMDKQTNANTTVIEYKFSDPLIIAENLKSIVAINNFKFSEPLCKKSNNSSNVTLNFKMPENKLPNLIPNKTKNNGENSLNNVPAPLKTGNVAEILAKKDDVSLVDKFKPPQGSWECSSCMIRNQAEKTKCVACETPKSKQNQTETKTGFGELFKMPSDKWKCNTCMVYNNQADDKCIACSTLKPTTESSDKNTKNYIPLTGFGNKFKQSTDTWECTVCMIRNKNELSRCAACETPKPQGSAGSTSTKLESSTASWKCASCQTANKEGDKCIICNVPKSNSFGASFKRKDDEWECGVCMVRNKLTVAKCQCCNAPKSSDTLTSNSTLHLLNDKKPISSINFGIDKASATSFNFGIPTTVAVSMPKPQTNASSIFGENAKAIDTSAKFSFGIPSTAPSTPKTVAATQPNEETKAPVLQNTNPLLKPNEKLPEKAEPATAGFRFGVNASSPIAPINKDATAEKPAVSAGSTSASTGPDSRPVFNFKPTAANGDINKTNMFDNKLAPTSSTPKFNPPSATSTNMFNFGAKPAATATPLLPQSTITTMSSQPETSKALFTFGSTKQSTENSTPMLGSTKTFTPSVSNAFGTTNTQTLVGTSPPNFQIPTSTNQEGKLFSFGNNAAVAAEPANKAPVFSFGQAAGSAAPAAPAKPAGFNFNPTTNPPAFNFAGGKSEAPGFRAPPSNNMFGAGVSNAKNGTTFNFGSIAASNSTQKASFNFGAPANSTTGPAKSGFNFGTAAAAGPAPASGGFNFTGATPNFNAPVKPSFNFTDGNVTAFTAQPSTEGQRKIKKAVRRTHR